MDAESFDAFYRANLTRIVQACALVVLDRAGAEDLAAEAFARLWSRWGSIDGQDHAGGFVFKTAMRLCWRELRRRRRRAPEPAPPGDALASALQRRDIERALAALGARQRQAVVLRDWAGFETKEIAGMLGMRESTVRVHLARGRAHLRELLGAEEEMRS